MTSADGVTYGEGCMTAGSLDVNTPGRGNISKPNINPSCKDPLHGGNTAEHETFNASGSPHMVDPLVGCDPHNLESNTGSCKEPTCLMDHETGSMHSDAKLKCHTTDSDILSSTKACNSDVRGGKLCHTCLTNLSAHPMGCHSHVCPSWWLSAVFNYNFVSYDHDVTSPGVGSHCEKPHLVNTTHGPGIREHSVMGHKVESASGHLRGEPNDETHSGTIHMIGGPCLAGHATGSTMSGSHTDSVIGTRCYSVADADSKRPLNSPTPKCSCTC